MVATTGIIVLALWLRLDNLGLESLWMDEIHQTSIYSENFFTIVDRAAQQQQPPLDYWFGHLVQRFSPSDLALRLPAALFGALSVFFLILLTRKVAAWPCALVTGTIMAMLPFHIYYSQEARPYILSLCLLLAYLLCLSKITDGKKWSIKEGLTLLATTCAYLYAITLAPLTVVTVSVPVLFISFILSSREPRFKKTMVQKRLFFFLIIVIVSILLYLPNLAMVLETGKHYATSTSSNATIDLRTAISRFPLFFLWQTYIVQLDPIGLWLLPLLVVYPLFLLRAVKTHPFSFFLGAMIPVTCLVHLGIFAAKANYLFQPRYAMYLFPLILLWAAFCVQQCWEMARNKGLGKTVRFFAWVIAVGLLGVTAHSSYAFKTTRGKTDWKGLCHYIQQTFGPQHVLIFDSLKPYGQWEPTFYGFDRYYDGKSTVLPMALIPAYGQAMAEDHTHEPVFILFYPRNHSLTPNARYPLQAERYKPFSCEKMIKDDSLSVHSFVGFCVFSRKDPSGNFGEDAFYLVNTLIRHLESNSTVIELHLAAAVLSRSLGKNDWRNHVEKARRLASGSHVAKLNGVIDRIMDNENNGTEKAGRDLDGGH